MSSRPDLVLKPPLSPTKLTAGFFMLSQATLQWIQSHENDPQNTLYNPFNEISLPHRICSSFKIKFHSIRELRWVMTEKPPELQHFIVGCILSTSIQLQKSQVPLSNSITSWLKVEKTSHLVIRSLQCLNSVHQMGDQIHK